MPNNFDKTEQISPDNAISLAQAARYFAVDGKRPSPSSVWRWGIKGIRGVKLQTRRYGRRVVTSPAACQRFQQELDEAYRRELEAMPEIHMTNADVEAECAAEGI